VTVNITDNDQPTFLVSNTNDSGAGSLRQAITDANNTAGVNVIRFSIGTGAKTINVLSQLPNITDPVIIDGTTQPGYAGAPLIELNGAGAGNAAALNITAGGCTIKGLVINRFTYSAINLTTHGGNVIQGNYLGTDINGTADLGNNLHGIYVGSDSPNNILG